MDIEGMDDVLDLYRDLFDLAEPEMEPPAPKAQRARVAAAPSPEAQARLAMRRLNSVLQADGLANVGSDGKGLKDVLKEVETMVALLSEYLRDGPYPDSWGQTLREVLSQIMDYQEALEAGDLSTARQARQDLEKRLADLS